MDPEELNQIAAIVETGAIPLELPEDQRQALTWKGALLSLRLDSSAGAVSLLEKLLSGSTRQDLKMLAFRFLRELALEKNQAAVDTMFSQAVVCQNPDAIEFLRSNSLLLTDPDQILLFYYLYEKFTVYFAQDPDQSAISRIFFSQTIPIQEKMLRIAPDKGLRNWAVIAQALRDPSHSPSLQESFSQFQSSEQKLCLDLLSEKAADAPGLKNLVCQLFVLDDYLPARDIALTRGYHPDDPIQAALFFFLAEDWPQYEQIDFSQKLLSTAYELAGPSVRRRILSLSRSAGQVDWLKNLTSKSQSRWLKELSDGEWESSIDTLASGSRSNELWQLAQLAPPLWSARILLNLNRAGWIPENEEENAGFSHLVALAQACHKQPLQFSPISNWDSPAREITSFALDHDGEQLAAGNSQTAILRWDLRTDASPMQTMFSQAAGTSALAFSPGGEYLVVSSSDHKVRLMDLSKGMIVKTLDGHKGLVRSLVISSDGRFLYTAGFDGMVQTWRFPSGIRVDATQTSKQELFGLAISFDGKYLVCAGAERLIQVYSLPQMDLTRSLAGHTDTITLTSASSAGPYAVTYSRDRTLKSWNFASGKEIGSIQVNEPLTSLAFHTSGQYVFGGTLNGDGLIWAFPCATSPLLTLKSHSKPVIGLGIKPDGSQLISASNDGKFYLWKLSTFFSIRTPVELLLSEHDTLSKSVTDKNISIKERVWLEFISALLAWRKRFDIEVAEMHSVLHVGEFDIQL
jgi:WD40 repeat protein